MPLQERANDWALASGFQNRVNVVYAGTLGLKHNPEILLALAREIDATVTVFSEGPVVERLAKAAEAERISNLVVRPWVPFSELPKMLAAADIVCALMEPDAGVFSVPSKVLSYLAAGKPILAAIPKQNLAARLIEREGAGIVVDPGDEKAFIAAGLEMLASSNLRKEMSENGRRYAETNFDIARIADRFESIISRAIKFRRSQRNGKMLP
jgi:colanic acid biosynthesis glycosyl transferase WcaI